MPCHPVLPTTAQRVIVLSSKQIVISEIWFKLAFVWKLKSSHQQIEQVRLAGWWLEAGCIRTQISSYCRLTYAEKNCLQGHKMEQTEEKQVFDCPVCSKSFGQKSSLSIHVRSVHEKRSHSLVWFATNLSVKMEISINMCKQFMKMLNNLIV